MRNMMIAITISSLFLIVGCQGNAPVKPEAPVAEAAKPAPISDEAKQALAKAEADVKSAKAQKSLWTSSEKALKSAQEAAAKGDSATTLKFAKIASEQAKLAVEQKNYPSTR